MEKKKTVLIVDDSQLIRTILIETLKGSYDFMEASDGQEAIKLIEQYGKTFSVILLDLIMPKLDGIQVLEYLKRENLDRLIPVIMVTSENSESLIARAYDAGTDEVIPKPFNGYIVKKRVENIINLYEQKNHLEEIVARQTAELEEQAQRISKNNDQMVDMLSTVIEYRSLESGQHIRRIRGFTNILLESIVKNMRDVHFTKEDITKITAASAMHDIGKIAIPDFVLLKPDKLTIQEFEIMKTHTVKGVDILYNLHGIDDQDYLAYCYEICLHHHERWDGKGYPDGLSGDDIPIAAQAVSIADVYDALTHKRIYKNAYPLSKSASMIFNGDCGAFSPQLLRCFELSLQQFEELALTCPDKVY